MSSDAFMPHGSCFLWHPDVLTLHVASDSLIALAYFSIPIMLIRFARRRKDIPFGFVFWMFATFIIACGMTHVMDIWTIWHPDYWLSGTIKALTAIASVATAVTLVWLFPVALSLRTTAEIDRLRDQLELKHRRIVETTTEGRWIVDVTGHTTFANSRLIEMLGYPEDEILGRSIFKFLDANVVDMAKQNFERCATEGSTDFRALFLRKDGTELRGQIGMTSLQDENKTFVGAACMLVDRTETDLVRFELAALERRYLVLGAVMPHIVWLAAPTGQFIYFNDFWYAYTGTTPESMLDLDWRTMLHPDDRSSCLERWRHSLATGEPFEAEFRLLRDGDRCYRWQLGSATAEVNAEGDIVEWVGSCMDIHDYRIASETRDILETIPQIVSMHGEDGLTDYINPRWSEYTGCAPGDGLVNSWRRFVHADDLAALEPERQKTETWRSSGAMKSELRIKGRDGAYRWFLTEARRLPASGDGEKRWLQTSTDIDDVKCAQAALVESEERYRMLTETMPQLIWTVDDNARFAYVNYRWIEYTGLTLEQSIAVGRSGIVDPIGLAQIDAARKRVPPQEFECEARLRRHDGVERWHLVRTVPIVDAGGIAKQWMATGTDIEERKAAVNAIGVAADAAVASTEAKSRFLATMSHEIRTPMSGVIGMTDLLLSTVQTEQQRFYATTVRECGRTLMRVLTDILDYSKIEAGKLELEAVDFDLASDVMSALQLMETQFQEKGVSLIKDLATTLPSFVSGDPGRLRQIIINLTSNALKFTPPGGSVSFIVTSEPQESTVLPVRFTISDTGIGIAPDEVERLFRPFSQADETTSRRYGGTGLGLSISAELVALMNGAIGVESVPAVGSSFWFTIPFGVAAASNRMPDSAAPSSVPMQALPARSEKVLLVEDNEVNAFLARDQFRRLGFDVTAVTNGRESVEAVQREHFDLIFMDCHMPEMDGFEATALIRKLNGSVAQLPIVAMTADARVEDREVCLAAGMNDYLSKPTSIEDLTVVIERWLPLPRELQ